MDFLEWKCMNFDWSVIEVPKGPINNIPALVQIMAWCRPGDKPLSEPMMVCLLMHICVTRPQWVILDHQYHGCWWPGDTRSHGINSYSAISLLWLGYSGYNMRKVKDWGLNKRDILQMTFSKAFSRRKIYAFCVSFHWNLFPAASLTVIFIGSGNGLELNNHYLYQSFNSLIHIHHEASVN